MHDLGRIRRFAKEWVAAFVGVSALVIATGFYLRTLDRKVYSLSITAGSREGLRYRIATQIAAAAGRRGISLRVATTSGSEESLERVN